MVLNKLGQFYKDKIRKLKKNNIIIFTRNKKNEISQAQISQLVINKFPIKTFE